MKITFSAFHYHCMWLRIMICQLECWWCNSRIQELCANGSECKILNFMECLIVHEGLLEPTLAKNALSRVKKTAVSTDV